MLTLTEIQPGEIQVHYENGVFLGNFLCKEDGFFDFWPDLKGGYWDEHLLRLLADELSRINKPWQDIIDNDESINRR